MKQQKLQSNLDFYLMSVEFRIRDWLRPPVNILRAAGVRPGMTLLDFGCGPGGFAIAAARIVGAEGQVYAIDIHPLAFRSVQKAARKNGLKNIRPISADSMAEISDATVDLALLYDVLHHVADAGLVLKKLHRLLKASGIISVSDHHLKEAALLSLIVGEGLFCLKTRSEKTYEFERTEKDKSGI